MVWNTTDQYVWYLVLCDCLCDSFNSIFAAVVHYSMVQKKRKTRHDNFSVDGGGNILQVYKMMEI